MSKPSIPIEDQAMQFALRVLGYRARSEKEMRQRLERKGFTEPVTDRTLSELARLGLLDDRDFAQSWVTSRPGRGPARLKQELQQKGITRDLAEDIVATNVTADDEWHAAWQLAERTLRSRTTPLDRNELLRLRRQLQRRGFSFDVIGRVCARINTHLTAEEEWLE